VWYHPGRIVRRRAVRRDRRLVNIAARCARQRARALHLLPHRFVAVGTFGIKLDPHGLRIEVIQIYLNVKEVLFPAGFLIATLASFQFLGDGLRDWLDVRKESR